VRLRLARHIVLLPLLMTQAWFFSVRAEATGAESRVFGSPCLGWIGNDMTSTGPLVGLQSIRVPGASMRRHSRERHRAVARASGKRMAVYGPNLKGSVAKGIEAIGIRVFREIESLEAWIAAS
jgi:hypothetical protein